MTEKNEEGKLLRWGKEVLGDTIFVGRMRSDGSKLHEIVFMLEHGDGIADEAKARHIEQADFIVEAVNRRIATLELLADFEADPDLRRTSDEAKLSEHIRRRQKYMEAAIYLKVPRSGDEEIDDMIREANRREAAVAALRAEIGNDPDAVHGYPHLAARAIESADALMAELETKGGGE